MEIEIYQINTERDKDDLCFMNTDFLKRKNITEIPARIYDKVFDGTVNCQTLEDVYRKFNIVHPFGYTSRSLSVSDIVRVKRSEPSVEKGCYFCDSIGFKRVDFRYALAKDAKKQQKKAVAKALGISLRQLRARQYNLGQLQELERGAARGLDIRTYADPAFSSQQMYQIRCDMKNHKDVSAYAKPVYDTDQMFEIREGVENGLDISRYADHQYDGYQMREIREGMEHGVDVSIYADLKYDNGQMKAIRQGLESGVDVSQYADPKFDMRQMEMLLRGLQNGLDVSRIADPAISAADMSKAVERMIKQHSMEAEQKAYTIQDIADSMHKVDVNAMQGGVTDVSFRCGNDQIDIQGYTIESGWESFEGSTAVWENGHLLYRRGAAHVDDYRQETYTLGQYPEYSEMVSYLQDKYHGKSFGVVKEKVPEVQESFERHWENPAYQKSLEAAQAKKEAPRSSLQEIVSSAKEYAQKNPEKLAQKNSPPSRGKVR